MKTIILDGETFEFTSDNIKNAEYEKRNTQEEAELALGSKGK